MFCILTSIVLISESNIYILRAAVLLRSRPAATATVPFDLGNDDGNRKQQVTRSFHILDESKDKQCEELPVLSFESIITSTSNFSKANLLGVGGFGPVYKVRTKNPEKNDIV